MNEYSSKSHVILIVRIQKKFLSKENYKKIKAKINMTIGFLYLVDLTGTERV